MTMDLEHGTTGTLDRIVPDIFQDELYGRDRRTLLKDWGETGSALDWEKENPAGKVEMKWWNAETQGNWWDGFFRTCCLVGTAAHREKAQRLVKELIATQDEDGYLGIYGRDLRFQHDGENGELWAQAVLLRALLGWGEMAGDSDAVAAALRALDLTIDVLTSRNANPFGVEEGWGGVAHGLMFTDVCEMASRITGEERYLIFAARLYDQFSEVPSYTDDLRLEILMRREIPFRGHGAHTYEHLRSLLLAAHVTGREDLKLAWKQAIRKLQPCLLPGGAGIGFEFILGVSADAERTATEFCTMLELRNSLLSALQKLGDASFGDMAEQITFNGILGARAGDCRHLAYCITDTCYCLDAHEPREGKEESRFKFSPAHQDVAVCCAPNAARQFPYFLGSMWASDSEGFRALLYGPGEIHSEFSGVKVRITEETDYPFSDEILFHVDCDEPVWFRLSLRVPAWAGSMRLDVGDATVSEEPGWTHVTKEWKTDTVRLTFSFEIEERMNADGRRSIHRGPLLFVHPIASRTVAFPNYPNGGQDLHFLPEPPAPIGRSLPARGGNWTLERSGEVPNVPWGVPSVALRGTLRHDGDGTDHDVSLVPMAFTVLRQASFD
jgi:DUF1680 family protein